MEIQLFKIFIKMYCPRCGFEGRPTFRGLTYGFVGSLFSVIFIVVCFWVAIVFFLVSFIVGWLGILTLFTGMFFWVLPTWYLGVCCPECRYLWVISLDEHYRDLKEKDYTPPHILNKNKVYKDGKIIPWTFS